VTVQSGTFVEGLRLAARVGVKPDELHREQPLQLDIHVEHDGSVLAADTGRLRDTLDYRRIARIASQVVDRGHFRLVETLAVEICRALLHQTPVKAASVRLHKLDCIPGATAAGVEVRLDQDAIHRNPKPITAAQTNQPEAVAIVGAGVAGFSAALWCWRLGYTALLIDPGPELGGQLRQVHFRIPDLPATEPVSGHALARRLVRQFVARRGRWLRARLNAVSTDSSGVDLDLRTVDETAEESTLGVRCETLIVATGLRRRRLGVPGEERFSGRGILSTASSGARKLAGKRVLVVGGGDAACENSITLANAGAQVTLVVRRAELTGRKRFRQRIASHPRIEMLAQTEVAAFVGEEQLTAAVLRDGQRLPLDAALIRIGYEPNSEPLPAHWLDSRGFVRCDLDLRVNGERRVFVAGDLRDPAAPSVASSAGDGASAAKVATAFVEGANEDHS
jgi:thioredoxin reductase (NADPH)